MIVFVFLKKKCVVLPLTASAVLLLLLLCISAGSVHPFLPGAGTARS